MVYGRLHRRTDTSRDGNGSQLQMCRNVRTMQPVGTSRIRIDQSTDEGHNAAQRSGSRRKGRPPKLGEHQLFSLRLPTDLHRAPKTCAFVKGRGFNDVIVDVEREHIEALVRMGRDGDG